MKKLVLAAAIAAMGMNTANADSGNFNYNYVQLAYFNSESEIGNLDFDGDGLSIEGSFELMDNIAAVVSYETGTFELSGLVDIDVDGLLVGVKYHSMVSDSTDIVLSANYIKQDISLVGSSFDEDGFLISVGFRNKTTDFIETEGNIYTIDTSDDRSTGANLGILFNINSTFQAGLSFSKAEDANSIGLGIRKYF